MKVKNLKPNGKNPRSITENKLAGLKSSIERFGDLACVVKNSRTGTLICGHQRVKVLDPEAIVNENEGYIESKGERFKYRVVDWDKTKEAEAMLAANKHGGSWDEALLKDLAIEFPEMDFEIAGFPDLLPLSDERYMASTPKSTEQISTEASFSEIDGEDVDDGELDISLGDETKEPNSKLGEIYKLGRHVLLCGDATSSKDIELLLSGNKPNLLMTDPPYGLADRWNGGTWGSNPMYVDAKRWDQKLEQKDIDFFLTLAPKMIIWGGNYYVMPPSRCWLAWDKSQKMETMADFELAWTNLDSVAKSWTGARNADGKRMHPTQKPIELMKWCLERAKIKEGKVLDLFGGSGTTLMACEQTGNTAYIMEKSPAYCDIIVARWERLQLT